MKLLSSTQYSFVITIVIVKLCKIAYSAFTFDTCNDWGSKYVGNCTVIQKAGALGAESGNAIQIVNGYMDYGNFWGGCPYKNNTCPNGFSFYGWMRFVMYPFECDDFGVVISTEVFNIHLMTNGHLAVYVWTSEGFEYYAESPVPLSLDIWYPIVVHFAKNAEGNSTWKLAVYVQQQLVAITYKPVIRTYTPPSNNLMFGGSGNGGQSKNVSVQFDTCNFDYIPQDLTFIYQNLLNVYLRQAYCAGKFGIQTNPLTCYWVESGQLNWMDAYKSCSNTAYSYGYPFGRLARFPSDNLTVWETVTKRLAFYGNVTNGYPAWLGGGKGLAWLDIDGKTQSDVDVPDTVKYNTAGSSNDSCLYLDTRQMPWSWSETFCSASHRYICEMSFDCLLNNPCKNFGSCKPINDNEKICNCWQGTSGKYCQFGTPRVSCIDSGCESSCYSNSDIELPENCTDCIVSLQTLINLLTQVEMQIKVQFVNDDINVEQAESWQVHLLESFENFTRTVSPNLIPFDMPDCNTVWQLYAKFRVHERISKKFMNQFLSVSNDKTPTEISDVWEAINETKANLLQLDCYASIMQFTYNYKDYNKFQTFFADNSTADTEWLKKRFKNDNQFQSNYVKTMNFGDFESANQVGNGERRK